MSATTSAHEIRLPARLSAVSISHLLLQLAGPIDGSVVVLRGTDCFCEGLDLGGVGRTARNTLERAVFGFAEVLRRLHALPHPLLAVVEGSAAGGGVGLAAACDVVLAGADATFALPEAIFGLTPAIVGSLVAARVGAPTLRRMSLTASAIGAHEALRLGLADTVVGVQEVQSTSRKLARALSRTRGAARPLRERWGTDPTEFEAGARQTLQDLRDPAVQRRIAAFERGECPWEATL